MYRLLIFDDELNDIRRLETILEKSTFSIESYSRHSDDVIDLTRKVRPDLILLDSRIELGSGLEVLRLLKEDSSTCKFPVVFYSFDNDIDYKIKALASGALDYILKSSDPREIEARILNKLMNNPHQGDIVHAGRLRVNMVTQNVFCMENGGMKEVDLSFLEYKILMFFIKNRDSNISRKMIIDNVWGENTHITNRTVDVHISGLRRRCRVLSSYIKTIYGQGYRFSCENETMKKPSEAEEVFAAPPTF